MNFGNLANGRSLAAPREVSYPMGLVPGAVFSRKIRQHYLDFKDNTINKTQTMVARDKITQTP